MSNPFKSTPSKPGHGSIHLALLPPGTPRLGTVKYQYPLKLVSPAPVSLPDEKARLIHTVYLLTYGGGLVAGDSIDLGVSLDINTRLVLLTQGSTKLFKSPSRDVLSKQRMTVDISPGSALCYLPDPVQPFERSNFEQTQIYNLLVGEQKDVTESGSICALDWVCNGRSANGENWSFYQYGSRNEIYQCRPDGQRRLLLRDNMLLHDDGNDFSIAPRMHGLAAFGTLILYGPLLESLSRFFMEEFKLLPRIGGRKWDSTSENGDEEIDPAATRRSIRHHEESEVGLLWSAASIRGCVVVKFGAREVEHGRSWLRGMLLEEGSVVNLFGERSLLCLR